MADKIRTWSPIEEARAGIVEKLRHYRSMVANYQACCEQYDLLFPSGVQVLTDMPRAQTDTFEPERWASIRIKQREQMEKSLDEMRRGYVEIIEMVKTLDPNESLVLVRRYMLGESMEIVARKISYSVRSCWRTHDRAILALAERAAKHE